MRRVVQWIALMPLLVGTANAQGWTAFSPEGGRCTVDMPGTPAVETVALNAPGQTLTMTEARVQPGGATFFIMLDKVRDGMAAGNTLRGEKKLTLGFRAARSPWRRPMAPSPRCAATERAIRSHKS